MQRKLTTILCADVVGYSRFMGRDEERALEVLRGHREIFASAAGLHGGRIFNTGGDSILCEFASAVEAVRAATEIQKAVQSRNDQLPEPDRMVFRIDINLGDVLVHGEDLLGDGVNVAARIQTIAPEGGICVSGSVFDQIEGKLDLRFQSLGEQAYKNIGRPVRTFTVTSDGGRPMPSTASRPATAASRRPSWPWASALLAVALGGGGFYWYEQRRQAEVEAGKAAIDAAQAAQRRAELERKTAADAAAKATRERDEAQRRAAAEGRARAKAVEEQRQAQLDAERREIEATRARTEEERRKLEADRRAPAPAATPARPPPLTWAPPVATAPPRSMNVTYTGIVVCDPAPGVATPPGGTFALTVDGAEASYRRQAAAGPGDPVETGTGKIGPDGQITLNGGFSGPTFQVAFEYGGRVSVAGFHLAGRMVVTTRNGARTTLSCSVAFESKTSPPGQPSRRPDEPPPAPAAPTPPGQATALDGEYNGTLVCVDATDAKRRYRAAFTLVIAGAVARYQRALITTDGQPNGQFERGAGTIDASGTLRLEGIVGGSDWRIVARYGGVVSHPRPRITGSQIVTRKDGTSDTRNCMVDLEFSRPDTVASTPTAAPAQPGGSATLDGEYTGTIVCVAATDGKRAFQAVFSLTIAGTTARYQRPAIGPDGQPSGQFERGAGTIDASGALRLDGVFVASDRKIAGQYGGVVSRPRSRITGTIVLTRSDGTSDTRNCTVDLEFFR